MPEVHRLDLMAEQSVIGAILLTDRCLTDVERELRPTDFRLEGDRALYEAALALERDGEKVDSVTILDRARKMGRRSHGSMCWNSWSHPHRRQRDGVCQAGQEESLRAAAMMETADRIREGVEGGTTVRRPLCGRAETGRSGIPEQSWAAGHSGGQLPGLFPPAGRCGGRRRQGLCLHRLYGPGRAAGRRDAQLRALSPGRKARHGENDPGS